MWKGACGIRPLGKGMPRIPATPVVRPSRKMSQWKPGGFLSGNSVPWAMSDETAWLRVSDKAQAISKESWFVTLPL